MKISGLAMSQEALVDGDFISPKGWVWKNKHETKRQKDLHKTPPEVYWVCYIP